MDKKLFGAKAMVYLKYADEMTELAKKLSAKLEIPEIYLDTDIDPPHDVFGMSETLGFEIWLHKSTKIEGFNFEIEIRTDMEHSDFMECELFDLSPWFAREISRRCNIETYITTVTE